MNKYFLGMTDFLIMTTLCLVFTVTFQLFATLLKRIGKSLKRRSVSKTDGIAAEPTV